MSLFPDLEPAPVEPVEKLSADRRRTLRQRRDIEAGVHPLHAQRLTDDPEATCGNCRFRELVGHHRRSYPKCVQGPGWVTHGAATDVRAWWPGCINHEYGDPKLYPDAARSGPSPVVSPSQDTP